jgi:hypothetical protein
MVAACDPYPLGAFEEGAAAETGGSEGATVVPPSGCCGFGFVIGVAGIDLDFAGTWRFSLFLDGPWGFDVLSGGAIEDLLVEVCAVVPSLGGSGGAIEDMLVEVCPLSLEPADAVLLEASSPPMAASCSRAYSFWYALMLASKSVCRLAWSGRRPGS